MTAVRNVDVEDGGSSGYTSSSKTLRGKLTLVNEPGFLRIATSNIQLRPWSVRFHDADRVDRGPVEPCDAVRRRRVAI